MNKKYIITGAHGTGKTSIMNKLKERGFNCIDENSRLRNCFSCVMLRFIL